MLKKLVLFCFSVLILNEVNAQNCSDIPQKIYGTYIQDHAHKLSVSAKKLAEEKVHGYKKITGIEICVALVDNIGDYDAESYARELANCYGVGEKGVDNGLTILISFDRKWFIKPGYATESYLTDPQCNQIGENHLVPNLRNQDVDQAVLSAIDASIQELGLQNWPEREAARKKAEQERSESFYAFLRWLFGIIVSAVAGFFGWGVYKREKRKQALRTKINAMREIVLKPLDVYIGLNAPKWAEKELQSAQKVFDVSSKEFLALADEIETLLSTDIDKAEEWGDRDLLSRFQTIENSFKMVENIPLRIKQYEESAPIFIAAAQKKGEDLQKKTAGYIANGFRFNCFQEKCTNILAQIAAHTTSLQTGNPDNYKVVVDGANTLSIELQNTEESIESLITLHQTINNEASKKGEEISSLQSKVNSTKSLLTELTNLCPELVWQKYATDFASINKFFDTAKTKLTLAVQYNSLSTQDFDQAAIEWNYTLQQIQAIATLLHGIKSTLSQQKSAQQSYESKRTNASSAISSARSKCNDSDVESTAKSYLSDAESYYNSAVATTGKNDWTTLASKLDNAKSKADDSYRQASRDISNAEDERAAARRRAEDERRRASEASSSSSSSSGSSFGGGRSGGGGSGGSW